MAPSGVVQREEPVDAVTGALLNVGGPVVVVDHVALVVDRLDVAHRGRVLIAATLTAAAATLALINIRDSLLLRDRSQDGPLLWAVAVDGCGEELPGLRGGAVLRQLPEDEFR